ncbi:hypothetical protein ACFYUJ_38805 [Streptomyces sp. NPDC004520]|uniref:hypothetical protein n=1 Tax=Streptomyces sp. NPDC004520 TaxID=3364702 RepID=UPI0036BEEEDD
MSALSLSLTWVPPEGIHPPGSLPAPAVADHRQVLAFPAAGHDTPERAAFTAGVAFGLWGLAAEDVARLTLLARELTAHVTARTASEHVIVISDYAAGDATLTVIALQGHARGPLTPRELPHVEPHDETGVVQDVMGPSASVRVRAVRP